MIANNPKVKAIFIVGHARSGTTLVNNIIKAHPQIAGGNETRLFRHFYDIFQYSEARNREKGIYSFHKDINFIYELIKKFVTEYYINFASNCKNEIFVEKTPSNELILSLIKYCFPNEKIIYCLRDGRDVWLSHLERSKHNPRWKEAAILKDVAKTWSESVNICFDQSEFEASHFFILKYETLMSEPFKQMSRMFEFCGVAIDEISKEELTEILENNCNIVHYKNYQIGYPGKWKTQMSDPEKQEFKQISGKELVKAGYEKNLN